ncbi:predicted protein [Streptomyces sp. C]|nr:predicted protein [Streptomyces sp. C]
MERISALPEARPDAAREVNAAFEVPPQAGGWRRVGGLLVRPDKIGCAGPARAGNRRSPAGPLLGNVSEK